MGDPKRIRKKYKTPRQPFEKHRIESDLQLVGKYGLRNKKEIWKHSTMLRNFRANARKLLSLEDESRQIGERELLGRLQRMGLISKKGNLDDVLSLKVEDFLERRLQTLVFKRGMATTPHHARQMIVHRHIAIGDQIITSPSYFVTPAEESQIRFASDSPFVKASHKALPANVYKSKKVEEKKVAPPPKPKPAKKPPKKKEEKIIEEEEELPLPVEIEIPEEDIEEKVEEVTKKLEG